MVLIAFSYESVTELYGQSDRIQAKSFDCHDLTLPCSAQHAFPDNKYDAEKYSYHSYIYQVKPAKFN